MRTCWKLFFPLTMLVACGRDEVPDLSRMPEPGLSHEMIELGEKLDDPYTVENMRKALSQVYPTKAGMEITPTDLYVRFLPAGDDDYERLLATGIRLEDHPMDYRIVREGDYYHDPLIAEEDITWQYAVVGRDFDFPEGIRYELLDECYISENDPVTRAESGLDWDAIERESYRLTGNGDLFDEAVTKGGSAAPEGRITIEDPGVSGGKPFGVAGVMVCCNSFVKFATAYTDRDGYYQMTKRFVSKPRYRLVFKNTAGFDIGMNLILVPASVSTLGTGPTSGIDYHVSRSSDGKLFRRCAVNNAAYEYFDRCTPDDLDIQAPPKRLRIWLFRGLDASSTVMLHHGAMLDTPLVNKYLGNYAALLKAFLPDVTIGMSGLDSYADLYSAVVHELSHASHYAQVGNNYWNKYINYVIRSYVTEGGGAYGMGSASGAGYCEVGEMWGYFMEGSLYKDRYGGAMPMFGTSYWFYPQIFRYLYDRGVTRSEIFRALKSGVTSRDDLQDELVRLYPERESMIAQVFNRYGR